MTIQKWALSICTGALVAILAGPAFAQQPFAQPSSACSGLPSWQQLRTALVKAVAFGPAGNGGLGFNMWGTLVATDGTVCSVAFSGANYTDEWLGSRVISAQKANTANDFSLGKGSTPASSLFPKGLALSTANLFTAVQPGGSLYGLQHSNPVATGIAYGNSDKGPDNASTFGSPNDPMVGARVGGVNVFGGGLGLFQNGIRVGGVGVSGDTSCTDHMVAWQVRHFLGLNSLNGVQGVSGDATRPDNIVFDISPNPDGTGGTGQAPNGTGGVGQSSGGFGHPKCLNTPNPGTLPPVT